MPIAGTQKRTASNSESVTAATAPRPAVPGRARALPHTMQRAHSAHAWQKEFLKLDQYFPVGTSGAPVAAQPLRITLAHTLVVRQNEAKYFLIPVHAFG
jgi:hypothetical protein